MCNLLLKTTRFNGSENKTLGIPQWGIPTEPAQENNPVPKVLVLSTMKGHLFEMVKAWDRYLTKIYGIYAFHALVKN